MAERAGETNGSDTREFRIELSAENLAELFVAWLNELLSLSVSEKTIFTRFSIDSLTQTHCAARVCAESASHFRMKTEVKAATYHQLLVTQIHEGWRAEVIFDV